MLQVQKFCPSLLFEIKSMSNTVTNSLVALLVYDAVS